MLNEFIKYDSSSFTVSSIVELANKPRIISLESRNNFSFLFAFSRIWIKCLFAWSEDFLNSIICFSIREIASPDSCLRFIWFKDSGFKLKKSGFSFRYSTTSSEEIFDEFDM